MSDEQESHECRLMKYSVAAQNENVNSKQSNNTLLKMTNQFFS
jgi:hypothetical protein